MRRAGEWDQRTMRMVQTLAGKKARGGRAVFLQGGKPSVDEGVPCPGQQEKRPGFLDAGAL